MLFGPCTFRPEGSDSSDPALPPAPDGGQNWYALFTDAEVLAVGSREDPVSGHAKCLRRFVRLVGVFRKGGFSDE